MEAAASEVPVTKTNEEKIKVQKVLCFTAHGWSRFIGWVELISNVVGLAFAIFAVVLMVLANNEESPMLENSYANSDINLNSNSNSNSNLNSNSTLNIIPAAYTLGLTIPVIVLSFIRCTVGIFAGVLLIVGVKQADSIKLRYWLIIEIVLLALITIAVLHSLVRKARTADSLTEFIIFLLSVFCICTVNVYRRELNGDYLPGNGKKNEDDDDFGEMPHVKGHPHGHGHNQLEDIDKSLNLENLLFAKEQKKVKTVFHNAARLNRNESLK